MLVASGDEGAEELVEVRTFSGDDAPDLDEWLRRFREVGAGGGVRFEGSGFPGFGRAFAGGHDRTVGPVCGARPAPRRTAVFGSGA